MSYETKRQIAAPVRAATSRILGVLAISLASAGIAHADPGMTREQVQAQLIAAERTGDIVEPWTQTKLNELYASEYQGKATAASSDSSRNQVTQASEAAAGADELSQVIALKNGYSEKAASAPTATASSGQRSQAAD
jgi:transcriptional regulator of acetoin/glycerol metabolism